ncbi:trans-2,3-dihydro-3-hydroxyanthranilate isomerase [Sulfobacillus thermosulfidooxidans DSM 9293]|uniref:Trans-2,3-dihydro-3-hydroxyanthranilate isomerase n=2 Tax=Sulfobacillus thermosulfidooxidans TaxID=28034 RepID=A0A1W1WD65_SULTA|nr:PhzF family phenazine biosynthesis protein [Sulfobacillus thermosulfidooxidans]PSR26565.1 MAG: PhzF family phenazine biosynthesis protein [Sulfobacillus thermosulfidooxidans]SMC04109.1 trans-2,3-dihydro-3-hydroxyanthranilate isomerase [Sulfobacillus thermosulfidooxidans DSM 9293]
MPKRQLPFMQVDVFTSRALGGNPLAVFYDVPSSLDVHTMQGIAREMNLSEIVFVTTKPDQEGHYRVRIFTPYQELPFAGHPTLGTYFVLKAKGLLNGQGIQTTHAGDTSCFQDDQEWVWMIPPKGHVRSLPVNATRLAAALGVNDLFLNEMMPPAACGTGLDQLIVFVNNPHILPELEAQFPRIKALQKDLDVQGLYILAMVGAGHYRARYFSHEGEDPATGSAAAGFGTYLLQSAGETAIRRYVVEQGQDMGRPSEIHVRLNALSLGSLEVGGRVSPVIEGQFFI